MISGNSSDSRLLSTASGEKTVTRMKGKPRQRPFARNPHDPGVVTVAPGEVSTIKYVCQADSCRRGFETWVPAKRHMVNVCHCKKEDIKMGVCRNKAMLFYTTRPDYVDPTLERRFSGELKTVNAPSEQELVDFVRKCYSEKSGDPDCRGSVDLTGKRIRSTFGDFLFERFGFGTFKEFCRRHDLKKTLP